MSRNIIISTIIVIVLLFLVTTLAFAGSVQYTYDDLNRLIKVEYDTGAVIEYYYDAAGNRTSKVVTLVPTCEGDFEPDGDVDQIDLSVFAADFGRTNCDVGDVCEGEFDYDNDVDGYNLFVFAADFGRTNCPLPE